VKIRVILWLTMKEEYKDKTKEQLVNDLVVLYQRIAELEKAKTVRKRAEEALRKSEERYRLLAESAQDHIFIIDSDMRIQYSNPFAAGQSGYRPEEIIGKHLEEVFPPDLSNSFKHNLQTAFESGEPLHVEDRFTFLDKELWLDSQLITLKTESGEIKSILGISRDITGRKRAEKAMRESEQNFRDLIENSPDGIIIADEKGAHLFANQRAAEITGYSVEELQNITIREMTPPEELDKYKRRYQKRIESKPVPRQYERIIVRKDGTAVLTELTTTTTIWQGKVCGMAIIRDITERKRVEEALQESEKFSSSLLDNSPNPILVINPDTSVGYVNHALEKLTGFSSAELADRKAPYPWWTEETLQKTGRDLENAMREGAQRLKELFQKKNGERFWVEITSTPVKRSGEFLYYLANWIDITERKRAEGELAKYREHLEELVKERTNQLEEKTAELLQANIRLQELDQLKSMFIASMSHELRTPLNSIIGFTGIILQGMTGEITEEQRKQLTMVKNSANHLLALINDVIDVSKTEADRIELAIEEFDLSALVQEVKDSFKVAEEDKGLTILLDMPETLTIESDERRTKQVIVNLVGNAVKFTDKGEIEIDVTKKEGLAEVSVRDTGVGIRKEDLDKLFKAFRQIPIVGGLTEGTGLGLYLSKKIADLLGGEIKAESEFGKGSLFTFTVPIKYGT
jgi:PAS domain S-box-containing protein